MLIYNDEVERIMDEHGLTPDNNRQVNTCYFAIRAAMLKYGAYTPEQRRKRHIEENLIKADQTIKEYFSNCKKQSK